MKRPSTKPIVDEEGRVFSGGGPVHYLIHLLPNGDEWRQLTSNAAWHIHDAAERRSCREWQPEDGWVVRADTHQAIAYYKAGEGWQEGWQENDSEKAARRQEAYASGQSTIRH